MKTLKSLIEDLDITLKKYNIQAYEKLEPALSEKEIDKNLIEIGIVDDQIKTLFQWKSGWRKYYNRGMMKFGGFLSFELIKEDIGSDSPYDPLLVPLISEGDASLLFNTKKGEHYGKLYLWCPSLLYIDYPISYYDSIYTMIKTTIKAYKAKAYLYNEEENWLYIDNDKFDEIAKKYNPNSKYWKDHYAIYWEDWYAI